MGFRALVAASTLGLALLAGCVPEAQLRWEDVHTDIRAAFPAVPEVELDDLRAELEGEAPPPVLLDARSREEFEVSHLPGAVHAPDLATARISANRDEPVVVYCSVGWRSARLVDGLQAAGYEDVRNFAGSIFAWANAGLPVVRGDEEVDEVHPFDEEWGRLLRRDLWSKKR